MDGPETRELDDVEVQQVKNYAVKIMAGAGHAPDEFDIDAEIDRRISVGENQKQLYAKLAQRGLVPSHKAKPQAEYAHNKTAAELQAERDADVAYMNARKRMAQEAGPKYREIPREAMRGKLEGSSYPTEKPTSGPLNPYVKKEEGVRMEAINPQEQNILSKAITGAKEAYSKFEAESKYAKEKRIEERTMKAVAGIGERSERLAVSELERREKELAKMEFQQSTAGRMISGIQAAGQGLKGMGSGGLGGSAGSSLLRESMAGRKGKGESGPGASLSLRPSSSYLGEGRSSMLSSFLTGGGPSSGGRQHGGHYVTVIEKGGKAHRVYVPGGEQSAGGVPQPTMRSGPTQPAAQSPLMSAMFGGSQASGRTAERPSALSMAMMGGPTRGKARKETGTPFLAMATGGHGGGRSENRPTLLQQATLGANKGHNMFAGATSKSHNSLFAAAVSNSKGKFKWR
jgi:hypothetical protein